MQRISHYSQIAALRGITNSYAADKVLARNSANDGFEWTSVMTTGAVNTIVSTAIAANVLTFNTGVTLYVDPVLGSDTPVTGGARGYPNRPFQTIAAANTAASAYDTVILRPGLYDERNIGKDLVNHHWEIGARLVYTGTVAGSIYDASSRTGINGTMRMSITGYPDIKIDPDIAAAITGDFSLCEYVTLCMTTHSADAMFFENLRGELTDYDDGTGGTYDASLNASQYSGLIRQANGTVIAEFIEAKGGPGHVYWWNNGRGHVTGKYADGMKRGGTGLSWMFWYAVSGFNSTDGLDTPPTDADAYVNFDEVQPLRGTAVLYQDLGSGRSWTRLGHVRKPLVSDAGTPSMVAGSTIFLGEGKSYYETYKTEGSLTSTAVIQASSPGGSWVWAQKVTGYTGVGVLCNGGRPHVQVQHVEDAGSMEALYKGFDCTAFVEIMDGKGGANCTKGAWVESGTHTITGRLDVSANASSTALVNTGGIAELMSGSSLSSGASGLDINTTSTTGIGVTILHDGVAHDGTKVDGNTPSYPDWFHGVSPGERGLAVLAATTAAGARTEIGAAAIASPTFTGTPAGPTAAPGTDTTQLATTAFVQAAVAALSATVTSALAGKQPLNANLTSVAALSTTSFGRSVLEAANMAALQTLAGIVRNTATLNFDLSASLNVGTEDLTMTVTGAAVGDEVLLALPPATMTEGGAEFVQFTGFVSAANTVTLRATDVSNSFNLASGTYGATVIKR
jgi:hypothetical protein